MAWLNRVTGLFPGRNGTNGHAPVDETPPSLGGPLGVQDAASGSSRSYENLGISGLENRMTGQGGASDKANKVNLKKIQLDCGTLDVMYEQLWACQRFVDLVIDDIWVAGVEYEGEPEEIEEWERMIEEWNAHNVISRAYKSSRLHGGAGIIMVIGRLEDLDKPLDLEDIKEGDLKSLIVVDRWNIHPLTAYHELDNSRFGEVETYQVTTTIGRGFNAKSDTWTVHADRLIRFDARPRLSQRGWSDRWDWGPSAMQSAFTEIMHDETLAEGISHLIYEASILYVKIAGFNEVLARGRPDPDHPTPEQIGQRASRDKSIYRTYYMDAEDEAARIEVGFGGLADLLEKFAVRLAGIMGVPVTKFLGRSPGGLNSTGEYDEKNYATKVKSVADNEVRIPTKTLYTVVARHNGRDEAPTFKFLPLILVPESVLVETDKNRVEAINGAIGMIDESEGRDRLSGTAVFGHLEERDLDEIQELQPDPPPIEMPPGFGGTEEDEPAGGAGGPPAPTEEDE